MTSASRHDVLAPFPPLRRRGRGWVRPHPARRRCRPQPPPAPRADSPTFGYDSFLDVVANIVGIVVILITIVGVRVRNQPPTARSDRLGAAERSELVTVSSVAPAEADHYEPDPPPPADAALAAEVESLRAEAAALAADEADLRDRLQSLNAALAACREAAAVGPAEPDGRTAVDADPRIAVARAAAELAARRAELQTQRAAIDDLRRRLEALRSQPPPQPVLRTPDRPDAQWLAPLSRPADRTEIHFRLARGEVAHVDLPHLIERLEQDARRQTWRLRDQTTYTGRAGPIGGFEIEYVLQRRGASLFEQVTRPGMYQVALARWTIQPAGDVPTETAEAAIAPGSRVRQVLAGLDPSACTITLWVYPDSFTLYRELADFLHAAGFEVAARPLPPGAPIAASPEGTRSFAQ